MVSVRIGPCCIAQQWKNSSYTVTFYSGAPRLTVTTSSGGWWVVGGRWASSVMPPIRLLQERGTPAAGSVLAIDIARTAATLSDCNVRDSFDHSIILLWQRHNLSHHIKSFSSISVHLGHVLSRAAKSSADSARLDCGLTHTKCSGLNRAKHGGGGDGEGEGEISVSHQRSHLVLTHRRVAVTLWSMLTLCFLHSYSHVHARASRTLRAYAAVLLPPGPWEGCRSALDAVSTWGQEEVLHVPHALLQGGGVDNNLLLG